MPSLYLPTTTNLATMLNEMALALKDKHSPNVVVGINPNQPSEATAFGVVGTEEQLVVLTVAFLTYMRNNAKRIKQTKSILALDKALFVFQQHYPKASVTNTRSANQ